MLIKVTTSELGYPPRHGHFILTCKEKDYYQALRQFMMEQFKWLSFPESEPVGTQQGSSIIKLGESITLSSPKTCYHAAGTVFSIIALEAPEVLNFTIADGEGQTLTFTTSGLVVEYPEPYYELDELIFNEFMAICTCGGFYASRTHFIDLLKNPNQKEDLLSGKELIIRSFLLADETIAINDSGDYELSVRGKFFLEVLQCI